jgi:hypothetical protein
MQREGLPMEAGMTSKLRNTGIGPVGYRPWGTHFCNFYSTKTDLVEMLVPFYEKVIKVKADVAALLRFDFRHISTEKFALGSLRNDDRQFRRPTVSPLLSVFSRNLASFLPCCIDLGWCVARLSRALLNGGVHLDP